MRRVLLVCLLLLPFTSAAEIPFSYFAPQPMGMGGTGVAWAGRADAPLLNPAWYALQQSVFPVVRMVTAADGDGWKLFTGLKGELADSSAQGTSPSADLLDRAGQLDAHYALTGPIFAAYHGNGYGLAVINAAHGNTTLSGTVEPAGSLLLNSDIAVIAGLGVPVKMKKRSGRELLIGINLKYVTRFQYSADQIPFNQLHTIIDPFEKKIPYRLGQAIGSDIGIIYKTPRTTVGLVWRDWFKMTFSWKQYNATDDQLETDLDNTQVPGRLSFGISYLFGTLFNLSSDYFSNTRISFDLQDFLIESESFFTHVHFGAQTTLFHTLTLRAGFNQGYFTAGVCYTLLESITFTYTYAGEEAHDFPGQQRIGWHAFSCTLAF